MSSLVSQLGNFASSVPGALLSYGSWGFFKGISLAGVALQIGAEYGAEYAPKVVAYAGEKLNDTFHYAAPKALTGLQYAAPIAKKYALDVLVVVGAVVGLGICVRKIRSINVREKIQYCGKLLEPVIRFGVATIAAAALYKVAPSIITTQNVAAVGLATCAGMTVYAKTSKYRVYAMIGVAITAQFLLK